VPRRGGANPTRHLRFPLSLTIFLLSVALIRTTAWAGPVAPVPQDPVPASVSQTSVAPESRYRLRSGDTLDVSFRFTPEFNQSVVIRPDGFVTLHTVGDVAAAGLTVTELTRAVVAAYAGLLRDPVVDVTVKDFERPYFLVGGEVQRPGKYDLRTMVTVREAVTIAGGFKPSARESQVLLFRRQPSGTEVRTIDVKKILEGRLQDDLPLEPGDMLFAPRSVMSKIERFIPLPSLGLFVRPWN